MIFGQDLRIFFFYNLRCFGMLHMYTFAGLWPWQAVPLVQCYLREWIPSIEVIGQELLIRYGGPKGVGSFKYTKGMRPAFE